MISDGAQNDILVATGSFTQPAKELAVQSGIQLLDGQALERAIQPLHGKISSDERVMKENSCTCPVCGAPMVVRTAKRSQNAGIEFWGCSNYPACRGTRNF
jgi:restriction system protein